MADSFFIPEFNTKPIGGDIYPDYGRTIAGFGASDGKTLPEMLSGFKIDEGNGAAAEFPPAADNELINAYNALMEIYKTGDAPAAPNSPVIDERAGQKMLNPSQVRNDAPRHPLSKSGADPELVSGSKTDVQEEKQDEPVINNDMEIPQGYAKHNITFKDNTLTLEFENNTFFEMMFNDDFSIASDVKEGFEACSMRFGKDGKIQSRIDKLPDGSSIIQYFSDGKLHHINREINGQETMLFSADISSSNQAFIKPPECLEIEKSEKPEENSESTQTLEYNPDFINDDNGILRGLNMSFGSSVRLSIVRNESGFLSSERAAGIISSQTYYDEDGKPIAREYLLPDESRVSLNFEEGKLTDITRRTIDMPEYAPPERLASFTGDNN